MIMAPSLGVERGSHLGHDVKRDGGQDFLEQSTRHHHLGHLEGKLRKHIMRHQSQYLGQHGKLAKIHVRRVKQLDGGVADYLFKHIKRRTFTLDDVLILPQSLSEFGAATNNSPRDQPAPDSRGGREDLNRAISGISA
jgi:hypothetical protein